MNRFVKKHYHIISFIILAAIFVAWGLLEDTLISQTTSIASVSESEESIPEKAAVDEIISEDETVSPSPASNNTDAATENAATAGSTVTPDTTPAVDTPAPAQDTFVDEIPDTVDSFDEPEPAKEQEPEPVIPPEEEVVLENGTYGPGEGKMPFDLCLANVRESLNVRSGPGEDNEVISKFYPNCYARLVEKGSEWSLISSGEITGYSHNDYLIVGDKAMQKLIDSDKLRVTVTQKLINVRAEKSTEAEILRQAKQGESFKCIPSESDSDWFAIIYDDGNIAFVATTLAHVTAEMNELSSLTPVG